MNVLIVGGAGFIGANLARYCLEQPGVAVTVMDSLEPRLEATDRWIPPGVTFLRDSLLDKKATAAAVVGKDIIFNCAGQSSHSLSQKDPFYDLELNCTASLNLLDAVRDHAPAATLVYLSTSTQVGRAMGEVIDEYHPERPRDIYSANKGVSEKYHRIYHLAHGVKTVSVRLANLFGPYGKGSSQFGVLNYFIHLARAGKGITLFEEARGHLRNVLYVEDACAALWAAANTPAAQGDAFFAVHHDHRTLGNIVDAIVRGMGAGSVALIPEPPARRGMEVGDQRISSVRFNALTGWKPRYDLETGIAKTKIIMDSVNA